MMEDVRFAFRQLRRSPGFFGIAALLIAFGIAGNTQMFTLVNAVILRPLPVRDPQNLVQLFEIRPKLPAYPYFDYGFYKRVAADSSALFQAVGQMEATLALERGGHAERVHVNCVTENYFTDLGVAPLQGYILSHRDSHVAVLSYGYWSRSFGHDPKAVGQTIRLKGHPFTIIGITPEGFTGSTLDSSPDLWIPFANQLDFSTRPNPNLDRYIIEVVARLRPGVSRAQAEQVTAAFWTRYVQQAFSEASGNYQGRSVGRLEVRSIAHGLSPMREQSQTALALLLAGTGMLLLMVCANVGGLLLARSTAREKETAMRLALGASRFRIFRQCLTESILLCAVGGAIGVLIAYASLPLLMRWMPPAHGAAFDPAETRTLTLNLHPDFRVIAFSLAACAVTAAFSVIAPAWRSVYIDIYTALKSGMSDSRHRLFQSVLCGFQVAICTLLLFSAGWMIRSLFNLRSSPIGFAPDRVSIFSIDPHVRGYDGKRNWSLQRRLMDGAKTMPGVEDAAIAGRALMRGIGLGTTAAFPGQKSDGIVNTSMNSVTPAYFAVMGIRFVAGRTFAETEMAREQQVNKVVVNEAFVRKFLNGQAPLGRQFGTGDRVLSDRYEIIGVVSDTKYRSMREVPPPIFYTYGFGPTAYPDTFILHVRTPGDPRAIVTPVRELLRSIDPELPLYQAATMSEEIDRSLWQEHLLVALSSCFGTFAMLLSAIGLYGLLAYFVTRRQREIGLRMALGAQAGQIVWLVLRRMIPTVAAGTMLGVALSIAAGAGIRSVLFGVPPFDLPSTGVALLSILAVGAGAAAAPALRAIRVDPATMLRND